MDRREFIMRMIVLGLSSSSLALLMTGCQPVREIFTGSGDNKAGAPGNTGATQSPANEASYPDTDLVIAGGTDPETLMEKGLQALGGSGVSSNPATWW